MISSTIETNKCQVTEWNNKKKKEQNCKFPLCKNERNLLYCAIHLPLNEVGPHGKMVKCSLCNQVMGEQLLKRHLPRCNKNIIIKPISDDDIITPRKWHQKSDKVADIPLEIVEKLRKKIKALHEELKIDIEKREVFPLNLEALFSKEELQGKNKKNIMQEASIIENMVQEDLFPSDGLYIELGCGAGSFSRTIQQFTNNSSSHLLIDRMKYSARNRYDHLIKDKIGLNFFNRLTTDIKDLDITQYDTHPNIIGISKHLCGNACDLSLSLFTKASQYKTITRLSLAIATCCHYLLTSTTFINPSFFAKHNISTDDFNILTRLSSWSTLKDQSDNYLLGKQIKEIIDYGRLDYLHSHGFKCRLIEYTSQTKENHLLLAFKDNHYS